jgi:hypothetical protein
MSQENVEVVRWAIAAYNRRDFEAIRALNPIDSVVTVPGERCALEL